MGLLFYLDDITENTELNQLRLVMIIYSFPVDVCGEGSQKKDKSKNDYISGDPAIL